VWVVVWEGNWLVGELERETEGERSGGRWMLMIRMSYVDIPSKRVLYFL